MTKREIIEQLYADYAQMPYISPNRDIDAWLSKVPLKKVPKKNMVRLENGLLPGHIILLWLINFETYTNEAHVVKYFEYTYGIDGKKELHYLIENDYARVESAFDSLDHVNADFIKLLLKDKHSSSLSGLKKEALVTLLHTYFTEETLSQTFTVRGIALTDKGKQALKEGQFVVDKHPKKPGYESRG